MTKDDLAARVRATIADLLELELHEVANDARLADITDDLGRLEIVMKAEDLTEVEITDDEAERLKTVGQLVEHLAERLGLVDEQAAA